VREGLLIGEKRTEADVRLTTVDDPTATLAAYCDNGFDAGFRPYQSTRLNRYNAAFRALERA
jgi:hypothetical protein